MKTVFLSFGTNRSVYYSLYTGSVGIVGSVVCRVTVRVLTLVRSGWSESTRWLREVQVFGRVVSSWFGRGLFGLVDLLSL